MKTKFNELVTGIEIKQQPELWLETLEIVENKLDEIKKFMEKMGKSFTPKDILIYTIGEIKEGGT